MSYVSDSADNFIIQKDFGNANVISDAKKIADIIPRLRNCYFMSGSGYLVAAKLAGGDRYVYKFLPGELDLKGEQK